MPECTCRGGNPNCYKCGGFGWIGSDLYRSPVSVSAGKSVRGKKKRNVVGNVTCPYCKKKVVNLDHHVSTVHPDNWSNYAELNNLNSKLISADLNRCAECGAFVRKLDEHLVRVHGMNLEKG